MNGDSRPVMTPAMTPATTAETTAKTTTETTTETTAATTADPWPALVSKLRSGGDFALWQGAAMRLRRDQDALARYTSRKATLLILATHTMDFYAGLLPVAGLATGVDLRVVQVPFGQVEQELLRPSPAVLDARPDYVLLAGSAEDLRLGDIADPDEAVGAAVDRWTACWEHARNRLRARVIQHTFVVGDGDPHGNSSGLTPGGAETVVARINGELLRRGGDEVLFVDCARLAAGLGRRRWHDPRLWHTLRQAVSFEALPALAAATAGVIAADLGLGRRCLVLDLDNTLWGGVLAEEGPSGIALGSGPAGEAYTRFQEYLLALRGRGMILAVASKNDADLVATALDGAPGMRLRRQDFAAVVADWRPKSEQILDIAGRLRLGLESIAFVDDNPAERAEVAAALPQVDVIELPEHPAGFVRALAERPTLAASPPTAADRLRARSYAGAELASRSAARAGSIEEFLDGLRMRATVRVLGPADLTRAAQLVQKTNQFNLTTRRRTRGELAALATDPGWRCYTLALRDTFADHGTVGVLLLRLDGPVAEIDTLLLSCRVIGRTAERRLLATAATAARAAGCTRLRGSYLRSDRNGLVADLYPELGFAACAPNGSRCTYEYDLESGPPLDTRHISENGPKNGPKNGSEDGNG